MRRKVETATNSGTVLTPLVFAMTGLVGGRIAVRLKLVKPFILFGISGLIMPTVTLAAALQGFVNRIESGNGDYPALVRAAVLSGGHDCGERESGLPTHPGPVIRPPAVRVTDGLR